MKRIIRKECALLFKLFPQSMRARVLNNFRRQRRDTHDLKYLEFFNPRSRSTRKVLLYSFELRKAFKIRLRLRTGGDKRLRSTSALTVNRALYSFFEIVTVLINFMIAHSMTKYQRFSFSSSFSRRDLHHLIGPVTFSTSSKLVWPTSTRRTPSSCK